MRPSSGNRATPAARTTFRSRSSTAARSAAGAYEADSLAFAFPEANGACLKLAACLYTVTPDEHFIIDRLPGMPQVVIASPCSGHGFKFGTVFGEVLADMAGGAKPAFDLSMFSLARFGAA